MQKNRFFYFLFFFLMIACSDNSGQETSAAKAETVAISKIISIAGLPPIYERFEDLAHIFHKQTDTTYIINFWASWCAPCVKELPYFEALNQKKAKEKIKIILVSLDFKKQLETKLKPFLAEKQLTSEVLILTDPDANSWVDKVNPKWSGAIPATVVYKGKKTAFYEQSFENLEELEAILQPFL